MAYNNGPGYIDVTKPRPLKPDEECIMNPSDLDNIEANMSRYSGRRSPRYPYCIVWTPIPIITAVGFRQMVLQIRDEAHREESGRKTISPPQPKYLFPFIGHMGICKSNGVIRDFAGSYHVSEDEMAFGDPTKIVQLDPGKVRYRIDWDTAIEEAAQVYQHRTHNLCCDNCHSMVALALNKMQYDGSSNWNMVNVWALTVFHSKYLSWSAVVKTYAPFIIFLLIILLVTFLGGL